MVLTVTAGACDGQIDPEHPPNHEFDAAGNEIPFDPAKVQGFKSKYVNRHDATLSQRRLTIAPPFSFARRFSVEGAGDDIVALRARENPGAFVKVAVPTTVIQRPEPKAKKLGKLKKGDIVQLYPEEKQDCKPYFRIVWSVSGESVGDAFVCEHKVEFVGAVPVEQTMFFEKIDPAELLASLDRIRTSKAASGFCVVL